MSKRPHRSEFKHFKTIATRWSDNDAYCHVNNVVYYSFFDTAVNELLIKAGELDIDQGEVIGLAVETRCQYFASLAFPDLVHVGIRVQHLGNSSVRYELGVFKNDEQEACALGLFVHVYVNRATQKPVPIPPGTRALLAPLQ
jgi:acyl-CoA thioester hydrolase